jgi:hypothetical protein
MIIEGSTRAAPSSHDRSIVASGTAWAKESNSVDVTVEKPICL